MGLQAPGRAELGDWGRLRTSGRRPRGGSAHTATLGRRLSGPATNTCPCRLEVLGLLLRERRRCGRARSRAPAPAGRGADSAGALVLLRRAVHTHPVRYLRGRPKDTCPPCARQAPGHLCVPRVPVRPQDGAPSPRRRPRHPDRAFPRETLCASITHCLCCTRRCAGASGTRPFLPLPVCAQQVTSDSAAIPLNRPPSSDGRVPLDPQDS